MRIWLSVIAGMSAPGMMMTHADRRRSARGGEHEALGHGAAQRGQGWASAMPVVAERSAARRRPGSASARRSAPGTPRLVAAHARHSEPRSAGRRVAVADQQRREPRRRCAPRRRWAPDLRGLAARRDEDERVPAAQPSRRPRTSPGRRTSKPGADAADGVGGAARTAPRPPRDRAAPSPTRQKRGAVSAPAAHLAEHPEDLLDAKAGHVRTPGVVAVMARRWMLSSRPMRSRNVISAAPP